jgi:ABC-2 type transport system permease protein
MGMFFKNTKMLWVLILFEAKRYKAFPTEIVAAIASRLIELALFITFWLLVSKYSGATNIAPTDIISFYLIIGGIQSFFYTEFGIGSELIKLVKYGELNQVLIRPIEPFLVPWSQRVGKSFINFIFAALQIAIGVVIAGGLRGTAWLLLPIVLFNTFVINLAFNMILGTLSFYMVEANGVKNTFSHIARLCGGQLIPLFLMPVGIATALQFTPFPAAQYQLAILLQGNHELDLGFVAIGLLWAIALIVFARFFWKRSLRRYEAVGA